MSSSDDVDRPCSSVRIKAPTKRLETLHELDVKMAIDFSRDRRLVPPCCRTTQLSSISDKLASSRHRFNIGSSSAQRQPLPSAAGNSVPSRDHLGSADDAQVQDRPAPLLSNQSDESAGTVHGHTAIPAAGWRSSLPDKKRKRCVAGIYGRCQRTSCNRLSATGRPMIWAL